MRKPMADAVYMQLLLILISTNSLARPTFFLGHFIVHILVTIVGVMTC